MLSFKVEQDDEIYRNFDYFKKKLFVKILKVESNLEGLIFKVKEFPSIFHSCLRGVIMEEIPSVAIDKCFIFKNTSTVEDGDLALSCGLLPIEIDPYNLKPLQAKISNEITEEHLNEFTMLLFEMNLNHNIETSEDILQRINLPESDNLNKSIAFKLAEQRTKDNLLIVTSNDLKWKPFKNQSSILNNVEPIRNVNLSEMTNNTDEIHMKCIAARGYGWDHYKFNPVSRADARHSLFLKLSSKINGSDAQLLQSLFPKNVIKIVRGEAVLGNMDLLIRPHNQWKNYESLENKVSMGINLAEHVWTVESLRPRCQPAHRIVVEAINIVVQKCRIYANCIREMVSKEQQNEVFTLSDLGKFVSGKLRYVTINSERTGKFCFQRYMLHGEMLYGLSGCISEMAQKIHGKYLICSVIQEEECMQIVLQQTDKKFLDMNEVFCQLLENTANYFEYFGSQFEAEIRRNHL